MSESKKKSPAPDSPAACRPSLMGHFKIARVDHWIKNVFVLPGIVVALSLQPDDIAVGSLVRRVILGLLSTGLIASSNYVLNEILDAPFDRLHPSKRFRPVPAGQVNIPAAYLQWLVLMVAGAVTGWMISVPFMTTALVLWVMGVIYNVRPVRSKDLPYVDVLSEAVNNPLRFLLGWFIVGSSTIPPVSLLISYWMVGCFFMTIKRLAEYREIGKPEVAENYRRSFRFYNETRLIVAIMFYASISMLFFGAFIVRYRLELVLAFPLVALVMATYLAIGFKKGSATQTPERLYREPILMMSLVLCTALIVVLLFVDVPALYKIFPASVQSWSDLKSIP